MSRSKRAEPTPYHPEAGSHTLQVVKGPRLELVHWRCSACGLAAYNMTEFRNTPCRKESPDVPSE